MTSSHAVKAGDSVMTAIDFGAYFHRIGYSGERTATLGALRAIIARHTQAIAFENLNPSHVARSPRPCSARTGCTMVAAATASNKTCF